MTFNMKGLIRGLQRQITLKIEKAIAVLFMRVQIKEIYEDNGKFYMRGTSLLNGRDISAIKYSGIKVGNGRGLIVFPKSGDLALVLNILGEHFYLTSVYDEYTSSPDNQIIKDKESMFLLNDDFGTYVCLHKSGDFIVKTKNGARIRLFESGGFKLFTKDNYGFDMDDSGNLTTRRVSSTVSTTPGTWDDL